MTITFADIHQEIEAGNQKLIPKSAALAYIDLFAAVFPDRWREKPARTGWFKANFPYAAPRMEADMTIFRGPRLYRRWRACVLNLIIAFGENETETPKEALYILAKNSGMTGLTDFKSALRLAFADDFALKELTREAAFEAEKALDPKARLRFRHALSQLDSMRFIPKVQTSELLGSTRIGQLPKLRRNGQYEVQLPPRLAQFISGLKRVMPKSW